MGNQQTKKVDRNVFNNDELNALKKSFQSIAGGVESTITETQLLESLSLIVEKNLARFIMNFLHFHSTSNRKAQFATGINFELYLQPFYVIERGCIDEKIELVLKSLQNGTSHPLTLKHLEVYVSSVLLTYVKFLQEDNSERCALWNKRDYKCTDPCVQRLVRSILNVFYEDNINSICAENLGQWLQDSSLFLTIWRNVFQHLYGFHHMDVVNREENILWNNLVPVINGITTLKPFLYALIEFDLIRFDNLLYIDLPVNDDFMPILDLFHIIYINSNLPTEYKGVWRLLFTSKIMGESFSTMLKQILDKGPSLLVVETKDDHIFGGFATQSWELSPNFKGDERALLFTFSPLLRCFSTTGYNNHYQYLNLNQETMPNGLGMGGQFNYWGLWLDCEYGKGHSSQSCTTFKNYEQLSYQNEFHIKNLEVWGVGDEHLRNENDIDKNGTRGISVLDNKIEERVLLELSGRKIFSDGLRELNQES